MSWQRGNYNCTFCNATTSGCDKKGQDLTSCHALEVTADSAQGTVMHGVWGNISMGGGKHTQQTNTTLPTELHSSLQRLSFGMQVGEQIARLASQSWLRA